MNAVGVENFFFVRHHRIKLQEMPPHRMRGQTLAIALETVAKLINQPNEWHSYKDHADTEVSNKQLLEMIMDCVEQMNLKGFYYSKKKNQLMFDLALVYPPDRKANGLLRLGE